MTYLPLKVIACVAAAAVVSLADQPSQSDHSEPAVTQSGSMPRGKRSKPHPQIVAVSDRLREVLAKSCPAAQLRFSDDDTRQLIGEHRTRTFQVYSIFKSGKIADRPHADRGPEHDGFLLRVTVQNGKYEGAAEIPQELRRPYWTTYINAVPLPEGQGYLWLQLSYGSRTDRELLKAIKSAVGVASRACAFVKNGFDPS